MYKIFYHEKVIKEDMPKIGRKERQSVKSAIEKKLVEFPHVFGKPLRSTLNGYWKLRVEDYRIIFKIEKQSVKILMIAHRSLVYKLIEKRKS